MNKIIRSLLCMVFVLCLSMPVFVFADDEEPITISVMHYVTREEIDQYIGNEAYHAIADELMAKYPEVNWEVTILPHADYETKLLTMAAANELPDIFYMKGSWVENLYKDGMLYDMSKDVDTSIYQDGVFTPYTRGDQVFALPVQYSYTGIVFYNEEMWADIGYDTFPATWAELEDACQKFIDKGIVPFALGNKDKWQFGSCILSTLANHYTGTEWYKNIVANDGTAKFTDPEFVACLETVANMGWMFNADFNAIANEQTMVQYCTGQAAATIEGDWAVTSFLADGDPEVLAHTRMATMPDVPGQIGESGVAAGGAGWGEAINSNLTGKKLEIAMEYVKATAGPEYSEYVMKKSGMPGPCKVDVEPEVELDPLLQEFNEYCKEVPMVPTYDHMIPVAVIDVLNAEVQNLLSGSTTPEAVSEAVQAAQDKLAVG